MRTEVITGSGGKFVFNNAAKSIVTVTSSLFAYPEYVVRLEYVRLSQRWLVIISSLAAGQQDILVGTVQAPEIFTKTAHILEQYFTGS